MLLFLLVFLLSAPSLSAHLTTEFTGSAFFPTSLPLRKIYGVAWQNYGFTVNHVPVKEEDRLRPVSLFGSLNYIFAHGASMNGGQRTDIKLVPLVVGLKWTTALKKNVELYIAGAPRFCFMKINNTSQYVPAEEKSRTLGGYVGVGSFVVLPCNMMIDFCFDYTYAKFQAPVSTDTYIGFPTNASGFSLGLGLGWRF